MAIIDTLRQAAIFEGIAQGEIIELAAFASTRKCSRGKTIFAEGSEGREFYLVVSGSVAINKNVAGGRKRNLCTLGAGEIFGELSLFDSEPRSTDAEAIEDCEVIVFSKEQFAKFLEVHLQSAYLIQARIIRILCKRLRNTNDMLNESVIWGFNVEM